MTRIIVSWRQFSRGKKLFFSFSLPFSRPLSATVAVFVENYPRILTKIPIQNWTEIVKNTCFLPTKNETNLPEFEYFFNTVYFQPHAVFYFCSGFYYIGHSAQYYGY